MEQGQTANRRYAVVAGGSGGIGSAISKALARDGFDVALTYRTDAEAADRAAASVEAQGRLASVHQLDLTDADTTARFIQAQDSIDALIYAAGPPIPMGYAATITSNNFSEQMHRDATASFNLLIPAVDKLRSSHGSIVAVVTTAVRRYAPRDLLSTAPKAAVEQIVRALAHEEGKFGVRANCVGVGVIDTGMWKTIVANGEYDERALEAARRNTPLRRFGTAQEAAEAVAFLASPRSSFITGQTLCVDGGFSL